MNIFLGKKFLFKRKIDKSLITQFVKLSGDNNPIHVNEKYAKKTSFKKIVAHGMLSESFISNIIGTKLPGKGSLWMEKNTKYLKIVRENDTITFNAEIVSLDENHRIAEVIVDAENQYKQIVLKSTNKVLLSDDIKIINKKKKIKLTDKSNIKKKKGRKNKFLILGSSGGIGYEATITLLKLGHTIYCQYNTHSEPLTNLKKKYGKKIELLQLNIENKTSVKKFLNKINKFEISHLINCLSPKIYDISYKKIKDEDFDYYFKNLFNNLIKIINSISKKFIKNNCGNIIDISSVYLDLPEKNFLPYITFKGAMKYFIKGLSVELANYNIRSNIITAGVTDTQQISDMSKKQRLLIAAKTPLKRIANPIDIVNAIKFLASEESGFVTGADIKVNGGII